MKQRRDNIVQLPLPARLPRMGVMRGGSLPFKVSAEDEARWRELESACRAVDDARIVEDFVRTVVAMAAADGVPLVTDGFAGRAANRDSAR